MSKTACSNCGSDNAPDGARFCSNCRSSLANNSDQVPMAAAIPVENTVSAVATASTVTYDEAPPRPVASSGLSPPNFSSAAANSQPATDGANYFLNPTSAMLERASSQNRGGILFIETAKNDTGKFTVPQEIKVGRILGDDKMDLSMADFVHPVTTITAGTILGKLKVTVPRGVRVEAKGLGILGGFKALDGQTIHAGEEGPTVVLQGFAILGGVKVSLNTNVPPVRIIQ